MGKLNKKQTVNEKILSRPDVTLNKEGGIAFRPDAKVELVLRVVNSLVSEKGFYASGEELDSELRNAIGSVAQTDPVFILKLALYARKQMYLRTVPMVLMGEYAMQGIKTVPDSRKYVSSTISRADELTELAAYYFAMNKNPALKGKLPHVLKHGIADAFTKFDEYQFAKYNRDGELTIRDVMFLTHPKPKDEKQAAVFKAIADQTLKSPDTWEVVISTQGSTKENWEKILPKMGYMALLRNLRNLLEKKVNMEPVIKTLTDPVAVSKSKQFPYRFASAYKEIDRLPGSTKILDAISTAADLSVANVPEFTGKTFVTCDTSGSMSSTASSKSKMTLKEIGCLFGAIVNSKSPDAVVSVFATDHVPVNISRRDSLLTNMEKMLRQNTNGYGTNGYKVMNWLVDNKVFVDRIVLFSDMQCYDTSNRRADSASIYAGLLKYRQSVNPKVFVYSFDLSSYATTQIPKDDERVFIGGGFSDKILNFIPMFERSRADMLAEIESITPS